jgi:hypothetical protein
LVGGLFFEAHDERQEEHGHEGRDERDDKLWLPWLSPG